MFRPRIGVLGALVCLLLSALCMAGTGAAPSYDAALVDSLLQASGVSDPTPYREAMDALIEDARTAVGDGRPTYRRARRLYRHLQEQHLRTYRDDADGIDAILDTGEFNCVSGSLLFGIVSRALGYEVRIAEGTDHLIPVLHVADDPVLVEVTTTDGFDLLRSLRSRGGHYGAPPPSGLRPRELQGVYGAYSVALESVSLEAGVAYIWHNRAQRALAGGDPVQAAEWFLAEYRAHPELAARSEALTSALARAFRLEYDRGSFKTAGRIAEIDLTIHPGRVSARDRLLAASLKLILASAEDGDLDAAEGMLEALQEADLTREDLERLERQACPEMVLRAVRDGEWNRALRLAERYASAEPDPVESRRLRTWVEQRREGRLDGPPRSFIPG